MPATIRPYQPSDLSRLQAITVEAFDGVSIERNIQEQSGPIHGHDWQWRKARHVADDAARDPAGLFVAEIAGQVAGYISTWNDPEAGIGYIPNLAVDSQYRGQGLGRQLIERAVAHFRALGIRYARIETLEQNPIGQTLYPSCGFREIARQIHYGIELD